MFIDENKTIIGLKYGFSDVFTHYFYDENKTIIGLKLKITEGSNDYNRMKIRL